MNVCIQTVQYVIGQAEVCFGALCFEQMGERGINV